MKIEGGGGHFFFFFFFSELKKRTPPGKKLPPALTKNEQNFQKSKVWEREVRLFFFFLSGGCSQEGSSLLWLAQSAEQAKWLQ